MNLVWHIFRKDCRRLLLPLSLWLVMLLAHTALLIHAWTLSGVATAQFEGLGYFAGTWGGVISAIGFILAAWLVMEDSLVVTTAFWPTRPISGLRLLSAKTVGAVLLLSVLPAVLLIPVWLLCGFSAGEVFRSALNIAAGQGVLSVVAFAFASVTATSGQFLVRVVGTLIVLPLVTAFVLGNFAKPSAAVGAGLAESRAWLVSGVLLTVPLVLIIYQFLTRRTLRSILLVGFGLLLMLGVRYLWSWDFLRGHDQGTPPALTLSTSGIPAVSFTPGKAAFGRDSRWGDRTQVRLQGESTGSPIGTYVRVESARAGWVKGSEWQPLKRIFKTPGGETPPPLLVQQVAGLSSPETSTAGWSIEVEEPTDIVDQARGRSMALQLKLNATLMRGRVLGELPVRAGSNLQAGSSRTHLARIEYTDGKVIVHLVERDAFPGSFGGSYLEGGLLAAPRRRLSVDCFLLVSRSRSYHQILPVNEIGSVLINSILVGQRQLVFQPPTREVNGSTVEIPDWEKDAVIVKVRFQPDHTFTHALTIEPFAPARL